MSVSLMAQRVRGWQVHKALHGEPIDLPVTEFVPPQTWVTSEFTASPKAHLIDWAVAVWADEIPRLGVRAVCGGEVVCPKFHYEEPDGDFCDGCLLADFVPSVVVYRFFDEYGELLYVGCTGNLLARVQWHRAHQPWWSSVARLTVVEYGNQVAALAAELEAIQTELPLFNRSTKAIAPKGGPSTW